MPNKIEVEEVLNFLNFLDPNAPFYAFTILGPSGPVAFGGTRIESAREALKFLSTLNGSVDHPTLHVTLNRTSSAGRKTKDIQEPRVLCIDIDRQLESKEIRHIVECFCPHLVVESSPKKYHVYWKLSPQVPLDTWAKWQKALAYYFDADLNLSQLAKNIRVPGIPRKTKEGTAFTPTIKYSAANITELGFDAVLTLFPWINDKYEEALASEKSQKRKIKASLTLETTKLDSSKLAAQGRNNSIYGLIKLKASNIETELTIEQALELSNSVNNNFDSPLDERELKECTLAGLNAGLSFRQSKLDKLSLEVAKLEECAKGSECAGIPVQSPAQETQAAQPQEPPKTFEYSLDKKLFPAMAIDTFSDTAIVERICQRYKDHIVRLGGSVYACDVFQAGEHQGAVWRKQNRSSEVLSRMALQACKDTMAHPDFVPILCQNKSTKIKTWTAHFLSNRTRTNIVTQVQNVDSLPRLTSSDFDKQIYSIHCPNGLVDMITGAVRPARAADYLLHRTAIPYVPEAKCPWFEVFVSQVLGANPSMITFMQELFGYSLSGSIDAQKLFIHYGSGCNGKSKILDILSMLMGDYTARLSCSTFAKSKFGVQKEFERIGAKLEGKRLVILDDLDTATQWNEGFVKGLTSKVVPSRRLFEEERDVVNRAKIHIGCNDTPRPESENYGILRRLCIIPYNIRFKASAAKEEEISRMSTLEASGILNWAVEGLRRVYEQGGLNEPEEVQASITAYKEETFNVSEIVKSLFTTEGLGTEDAYRISELTEIVNNNLSAAGMERTDSKYLGRVLAETLGAEKIRVREDGKREVKYCLKILKSVSENRPLETLL